MPSSRHLGVDGVPIAVDGLDATIARLHTAGVRTRSDVFEFHDRRLVFVSGPGDVTIGPAEWMDAPT